MRLSKAWAWELFSKKYRVFVEWCDQSKSNPQCTKDKGNNFWFSSLFTFSWAYYYPWTSHRTGPRIQFQEVQSFVEWCDQSNLILNVQKTKEIIFDFRRSSHSHEPITIHGHPIEQVPEYKYLGTIIDKKLNWNPNSQVLAGKANQRLYFLRKLREFRVDNTILVLFYQSLLQSILTFSLVCMYGNQSNENVK